MKMILNLLLGLLTAGVVAYVGLVAFLFLFQRSLLYHPGHHVAQPADVGVPEMRPVTVITEDGLAITGWHAPPAVAGRPTVVLFHGNGGTLAGRAFKAQVFLDAGLGVMLAGYRGYAGNPGRPTEAGLYRDARAALRWLAEQGVDGRRLVLYGESLGTGVATQMATEGEAAALILEAPFTSIPDVARGLYPFVPVDLLTFDRFDSLSKIGRVRAPVMVMHGEADNVVPFRLGRRLFDAAPGPKRSLFLPFANHVDLYDWEVDAAILDFIRETTSPADEVAPPQETAS